MTLENVKREAARIQRPIIPAKPREQMTRERARELMFLAASWLLHGGGKQGAKLKRLNCSLAELVEARELILKSESQDVLPEERDLAALFVWHEFAATPQSRPQAIFAAGGSVVCHVIAEGN